ncbi:hypothetical protein [Streptomyces wuyuanensis]|uniref:hypothetical protein n=1 Tax=Streptomyces wuyuanensis TaxID=1196353 RepID=UPI00342A526C
MLDVPLEIISAVADTRLEWETAPGYEQLMEYLRSSDWRLFCTVNVPKEEWEVLRANFPDLWDAVTNVAVSCDTGVTRPGPRVFRHVLDAWQLRPEEVVFVDTDIENLQFSRAQGLSSLRYHGPEDLSRRLRMYDPEAGLRAAERYLVQSLESGAYETVWYPDAGGEGRALNDIYSVLLMIHENDWLARQPCAEHLLREIHLLREDGLVPFFRGDKLPPDVDPMPLDVDDTSLLYSTLLKHELFGVDEHEVDTVAARIAANTDDDGVICIYFDRDRPRIDAVVCANALFVIHLAGRGGDARATEDHVHAQLTNRAYEDGTLYFPSPDLFLYFVFRLVRRFPSVRSRFGLLLAGCVAERIGTTYHALDLAVRTIMCRGLDIPNHTDVARLLMLQQPDGSWDPSPYLLYPSLPATGYNRTVETALAAAALHAELTGRRGMSEAGLEPAQ